MSIKVSTTTPVIKLSKTGTAGPIGKPGTVWRNGSGLPNNSVGVDGDYYLRTLNGDVYEKQSGAYILVANISGGGGGVSTEYLVHTTLALATTGAFQRAVTYQLEADPVGAVTVIVNGLEADLDDKTKDFYLSGDNGTTARAPGAAVTGDKLYVGSGLEFQLETDDEITIRYLRAV